MLAGSPTLAADWPQILGPQRNGRVDDAGETLPDQFPERQLTPQFTYPLGDGYAGPAVVGRQVILFHRLQDEELVDALDADTGQRQWRTALPAEYSGGFNPDNGPRCVPLIHDGRVYVFGASGRLHCLELSSGKKIWSRALARDYDAPEGYFGAGSTPILAGDRLLVHVGGREGAAIVAVALADGRTIWTSGDEQVSYASPTAAELAGQQHYLFLGRLQLLSIDPQTGATRFAHPFGKRGLTVTAATPVVQGPNIFLSASYNIGADMLQLEPDGTLRVLWSNDRSLSSQYANAVAFQDHIYGTHGREDGPMAGLRCVEAATGKVKWSRPDVGVAHVIGVDDKLLILGVQTGELVLLRAEPSTYTQLDARPLGNENFRALPALSRGVLYVRTHGESAPGGELRAYRVSQAP